MRRDLLMVAALGYVASAASVAWAAPCDFAPLKRQIDIVLDQDPELSARFRRAFAEGSDSLAVLERLVPEEMRENIDICRFDVAEYLAKRGFPPGH